jgi:hypothetical protein
MPKIIQIYPCLLKLSRKEESVTDGQTDGRLLLLKWQYKIVLSEIMSILCVLWSLCGFAVDILSTKI